ncbi:MAG: LamG-like jellyroll fold domain-containing protein [Verrucomicrobiota bacterium]
MTLNERLQQVTELTSSLLDGSLDRAGQEKLNDLLRGDPDTCERYLDLTEAHAALLHDHVGDELLPEIPEKVVAFPSSRKPRPWMWAAAAAVLLILGNAAFLNALRSASSEEPQVDGDWVAVVSHAVDPVFEDSTITPAEGDALAAGPFHLKSGLIQIEFFSGASVIVEGPAKIHLRSPWLIECQRGRLRTFVPEPAQGFTILTPEYQAVDLGTEFALSVNQDGHSELHVVDGEVRVDDFAGREIQLIEGGGGIRSADGNVETLSGGGGDFIGREQLLDLAAEDRQTKLQEWRRMRRQYSSDPDTLVFFDFENQDAWDRQLTNQAKGGRHAAIIGAQWTEGRWRGKGALEFKRITDRVRIEIPGEFDSLTYAAWVRIEGLDKWLSSLMLTDGWDEGDVHWQISDLGEVVAGIKTLRRDPNTTSPPLIQPEDLGRWIHLATTLKSDTKRVIHYINGEAVLIDDRDDLTTLRIGSAEIGNWKPELEGRKSPSPIRSLNGRLDEFLVMKRALSATEVAALYEAGR